MYDDDNFDWDYNNEYGVIEDPFSQNNDANKKYID